MMQKQPAILDVVELPVEVRQELYVRSVDNIHLFGAIARWQSGQISLVEALARAVLALLTERTQLQNAMVKLMSAQTSRPATTPPRVDEPLNIGAMRTRSVGGYTVTEPMFDPMLYAFVVYGRRADGLAIRGTGSTPDEAIHDAFLQLEPQPQQPPRFDEQKGL